MLGDDDEVDWKGKFMANGNKTARDVCSRDRARIPCIQKEQDCLKSHTDRITLVAHNFQAFCEVPIDALNNYRVVVCT